jgi:hypothetical protein
MLRASRFNTVVRETFDFSSCVVILRETNRAMETGTFFGELDVGMAAVRGEVKIEIHDNKLCINGQSYGQVKPDGTLHIDVMNGLFVMVDGEIRRPETPTN